MGRLLHYQFRGLLSVHSRYNLQAHQVALCDPLHRRLQRLRCLHRCSDCYRAERSSSRAGLSSRCGPAPFTAHCKRLLTSAIGLHLLGVAKKSRLNIGRHSVGYDSFYSLRRKPSRSFGQKVPIRRTPAMVSYLVPTNPAQTIWRVLFHHQRAAELPC